jgi:SAM-dependent methyltransferase
VSTPDSSEQLVRWISALEARHLADLRFAEVTRALRALSSAYVERRHKVASGATLDSAGKRAAFALYYGPLHFLATQHVVKMLSFEPAADVLDLGCGTGTVGAAWALTSPNPPAVTGIDRHPWAVDEAKRTYRELGVSGHARIGDVARLPALRNDTAVAVGYLMNELPEVVRRRLEDQLVVHARGGARVLILEPIARAITPWWDETAARMAAVGGRADEWRFRAEVPDLVARLGKAAGLDYRELRLRSICAGSQLSVVGCQ